MIKYLLSLLACVSLCSGATLESVPSQIAGFGGQVRINGDGSITLTTASGTPIQAFGSAAGFYNGPIILGAISTPSVSGASQANLYTDGASVFLSVNGGSYSALGSPVWGAITGTLSSQSDLNTALGLKAPLISPSFTTPILGTPTSGTLTNCTGLPAAGVTGTAVTQTTLSNATLPASFATLAASGAVTFTGGSTVVSSGADAANFEWGGGVFSIYTASNKALRLGTNGANKWQIGTAGDLTAITDNSYDIGASGATRPRNLFLGGNISAGGTATISGTATITGNITCISGSITATVGGITTGGNLVCSNAGNGLILKSGTGARAGNATLVGGSVTVANTTVTANTVVIPSRKTPGGTLGNSLSYSVSAGTSFTITSVDATGVLSALDTSVCSFLLIELN